MDKSLTVRRSEALGYVQFADASWLCFDLAADPTWRTPVANPAVVLAQAQAMLAWRAQHADRTLTGMLALKVRRRRTLAADAGGVGARTLVSPPGGRPPCALSVTALKRRATLPASLRYAVEERAAFSSPHP